MKEYLEEQNLLNARAGVKHKDIKLMMNDDDAWSSQSAEDMEAALQTWEAPSRRGIDG